VVRIEPGRLPAFPDHFTTPGTSKSSYFSGVPIYARMME
jgi:hypothetical protein